MFDDNQLIFDFMKDFENENLEAADTPDNPAENAEPVQETTVLPEPACPQSQEVQAVQHINQSANNNPQFSLAASVINAVTSATCVGKNIQIPNYPLYAKVMADENCNVYFGIPNQQTNQYENYGTIVLENSEYAVYQIQESYRYKVGTLRYSSFEDSVWYFVPVGTNVPQQIHNTQYPAYNNQQIKYIFNNAPPEHAESIVNSVMENNPQNTVEINFSSHTLKSGSPFITVDELKAIIDILPE